MPIWATDLDGLEPNHTTKQLEEQEPRRSHTYDNGETVNYYGGDYWIHSKYDGEGNIGYSYFDNEDKQWLPFNPNDDHLRTTKDLNFLTGVALNKIITYGKINGAVAAILLTRGTFTYTGFLQPVALTGGNGLISGTSFSLTTLTSTSGSGIFGSMFVGTTHAARVSMAIDFGAQVTLTREWKPFQTLGAGTFISPAMAVAVGQAIPLSLNGTTGLSMSWGDANVISSSIMAGGFFGEIGNRTITKSLPHLSSLDNPYGVLTNGIIPLFSNLGVEWGTGGVANSPGEEFQEKYGNGAYRSIMYNPK